MCRFMICCDTCEDWFHGNCVGITVAQGKRMEREGKDYVCPLCLEKEQKTKEEREADRCVKFPILAVVNILQQVYMCYLFICAALYM